MTEPEPTVNANAVIRSIGRTGATPPRRRRRGLLIMWVIMIVAIAAIGATSAAMLGGGTSVPAAATSPSPACQTYGLTGCEDGKIPAPAPASTSPPPPVQLTVASWVTSGGGTQLSALTADFATIGRSTGDLSMKTNCGILQRDIQTAQAYPPIPDPEAQSHWSAALAAYSKGAADCVTGVDKHNSGLIGRSASEFAGGQVDFDAVLARLRALAPA